LDQSNFYINQANGSIALSWNKANGLELNQEALFTMETTADFDANSLQVSNQRVNAEIYTDAETKDLQLVTTARGNVSLSAIVYPNPWHEELQMEIDLIDAGNVIVDIRDVNGKRIYFKNQYLDAGKHQLIINDQDIPTAGLYYCLILKGDQSIQKRLIKVE